MTTELLEILELYCELLLARVGLLEAKDCDPGLEEAVVSLLYAAPRTDVKELHTVRQLLAEKFGKDFALAAADNSNGKVAPRVLDRLRVEPPRQELVDGYLRTIAEAYAIDWPRGSRAAAAAAAAAAAEQEEQDADDDDDDQPGSGGKAKVAEPLKTDALSKATPPRNIDPLRSPVSVMPPSPSTDNIAPKVKLPGPPDLKPGAKMQAAAKSGQDNEGKSNEVNTTAKKSKDVGSGPGGKIPDVDELAKRFAQLKR